MGGSVKFEDALAMRLDVMKPSQADVDRFKELNPPKISKGEMQRLRRHGCTSAAAMHSSNAAQQHPCTADLPLLPVV
jgi:hypothetical protein